MRPHRPPRSRPGATPAPARWPPTWTTVISGIAAKLSTRPANVTRPNSARPTGASASSAQMVAAHSVPAARARSGQPRIGHARTRRLPRSDQQRGTKQDAERRPERQDETGVEDAIGDTATASVAADAPARSATGPGDRAARAASRMTAAVTARATDAAASGDAARRTAGPPPSRSRRLSPAPAGVRADQRSQHGKDRDVAAGDRDDVIGAGLLQPPLVLRRTARCDRRSGSAAATRRRSGSNADVRGDARRVQARDRRCASLRALPWPDDAPRAPRS